MKDYLRDLLALPKFKALDLHQFEDGGEGEPNTAGGDDPDNQANGDNQEPDKKYSDDDVNKIIEKKFAEWQKKQEKAKKEALEAEKLKNMTDQEKKEAEYKKLQEKLEALEQKEALESMSKVARGMLNEASITINDDLLESLVVNDADKTKANVENFIDLFNSEVKKAVAEQLKGTTPKQGSQSSMTKAEIMKVANRAERQKLIRENMNLFR